MSMDRRQICQAGLGLEAEIIENYYRGDGEIVLHSPSVSGLLWLRHQRLHELSIAEYLYLHT